MRKFVLDTGVVLANLTNDVIYETIEKDLELDKDDIVVIMPISVKAEILTIGMKRKWGLKRMDQLNQLLDEVFVYAPDNKIVDAYVKIDVY